MIPVSVVLFDLDDTLFAHRRATEDGVLAHLRAMGLLEAGVDTVAEAKRWNELEEKHYARYLRGELDYLGQRRARASDFLAPYGVVFETNASAEEWFDGYALSYRSSWTLHDDALPMLDALSSYKLGIITNGVTRSQLAKLDLLGLTPYFSHLVASGDFGAVKPDPSIFLHACSLFDVLPASAVYVGDRLRTDALGAVGAGLGGIWLDRADSASPAELAEAASAGVAVIHSLDELVPLLSSAPFS